MDEMNRRQFVKIGAGLGAATGTPLVFAEEEAKSESKDMIYRELGDTKLKVSAVSLGTYGFSNSGLLERALDKGINFICTAAEYQNGVAEESIGKVAKKRRKDMVIMTGWSCRPNSTKQELIASLDASLKRLSTDYVDIVKTHNLDKAALLDNEAQFEAFEEAKKTGKVGFLGLSNHNADIIDVLQAVLKKKKFHVLQCKFNFMEYEKQMKIFDEAEKLGIGIVAFKVRAGKRENEIKELENKGLQVRQAAIRWALNDKRIASVCMGFTNFDQIDEYREAVMKKLSRSDEEALRLYAQAVDRSYCRNCSTCEAYCPNQVAVAEIMRYSMYFKYYKMEKEAMRLYSALPPDRAADPCAGCGGFCEQGCPYGRPVRTGLLEAREMLT
ncbi:MAG: aldo/keto reductase [Candidatus Omnitrophota bacterium]